MASTAVKVVRSGVTSNGITWKVFGPESPSFAPLTLVHGFACSSDEWGALPRMLATKREVMVYDQVGLNDSKSPTSPITISDMANDVHEIISQNNFNKTHIMGISMGGMIAQEIALRSPSKIASLVLGATTHGGREAHPPPQEFLKLCGKWVKSDFDCNITQKQLAQDFIRFCTPPDYETQPGKAKMFSNLVEAFLQTSRTPEGLLHQLSALAKFNSTKELSNIQSPTLVVHGTHDIVVPYANGISLSQRIPNAEMLEWSSAGHFFWNHEPVEFSRKLSDFLDRSEQQA